MYGVFEVRNHIAENISTAEFIRGISARINLRVVGRIGRALSA